jgi:SAM-dependent methyltransferase
MRVPEAAYPYLVAQRGALDDMKGDSDSWLAKYFEVIKAEFACIEKYLPRRCDSILDVGGGMGGIDCFLNHHYGGGCQITILDGVADPPQMTKHSKTFNDMAIAREFLFANDVQKFDFIDANDAHRRAARKYDLIVSFKSWCFHYPPEEYLDLVLDACHPDSMLIIDVRREKYQSDWLDTLRARFSEFAVIYPGLKFQTCIFEGPK